jgi:hypothetical protein
MESYRDVAEEIALNVGIGVDIEKEINKILEAVNYAEHKMLGKSRAIKFFWKIKINKNTEKYQLPKDFNTNQKVVITNTNLERYSVKEIEFEQLVSFEATPVSSQQQVTDLAINPELVKNTIDQVGQNAMYGDSVLYAMYRTTDGYELCIRPKVDGCLFIYYSAIAEFPIDIEKNHPNVSERFWHGVVSGATYYLLRRQATAMTNVDPNKSLMMLKMSNEYKNEFQDDISELADLQQDRAEPFVLKPFKFYEEPESYL